MKRCTRSTLTPFAIATLLAACGGGSDTAPGTPTAVVASPATATTTTTTTTTVTTPSNAASSAAATPATCSIPDFAATALARINQLRAAGADCRTGGVFAPAAALTWNALLTQSAFALSQDMVTANFFSHTGSNGSTLASRVDATGYAWSGLGENIAAGYATIDAVMAGWMASDGHCANLMNPTFSQVGLACVAGTSTDAYPNYWTMDLAKPR